MKLHLPSGLRKALLACLAAVALPISLPTTVASASGIAAVLLFAGQEARADFSGPQGGDYTSHLLWQADEGTIDTMSIGEENTEVTLTGDAPPWVADNNPRSTLKYDSQGTPGPHLKLNGTDGTNTEYRYALLDDFKTIWFAGVGRHFVNGTTDFSRSIEAIYVNGAQLVFDGASLTDLTTNFFIGSSSSGANGAIGAIYVATGANIVTTGTLNVEEDAVISFASGSLSFASVTSEGKLTLATTTGGSGTFTLGGGTLQTLDLAAGVTLSLGGDLTLEGDSTISGTLTGEGNIILVKKGEITISSAGNNLAELVTKLAPAESVTSITLNSSGEGDVTIESSLDLTNVKLRKESGTLTLTQGGTFGQESELDQLDVTGGSLTLNAVLYLKKGGSINSYDFGDKGGILLGDEAELTLGGDGDVSSRIQLQKGASSAWLTLTGGQKAGAKFAKGINVRFDRSADNETADTTGINFTEEVTVQGDVEITDGTYVKFSGTGGATIAGELSGDGSLVFDRKGQTLTLGKGGSIGELQVKQGSAEIGGYLSGNSLVFGAGVTLTFDEGGSFGKMEMTGSGHSDILLGGNLEVDSLNDASGTYSVKKAEGETGPVHFVLGMEDDTKIGFLTNVEQVLEEFTDEGHKGLTVGDGVGIGFVTSKTIELKDGGTMHRDFKFKGREGTGTLKFSNKVNDKVTFEKHLTLEDAHVEMAGGALSITGGLILTGHNTMELTTAANGGASVTFGGTNGNFSLSGDGELEIVVSLFALVGKNSGDIWLADFANWKNWQDDWARQVRVTFAEGMPYADAAMDENGKLIWGAAIEDDFTGITYDTVETNADASIKGNTVIAVTEDDIAKLTPEEGANLKLVAGKDGIGQDGSGEADPPVKADLSGLASVYFTGKNGYFVENGWFGEKGPGTIYVRDTQLYFSGERERGNTADLTNLTSNFVIGGSQHGAADVGAAALALSKTVKTTGSLTLKEDATIAFLLNDAEDAKDAWMSFGGKVNGSGKTLTLSEKGTGNSHTAGLELNGGGTLGKLVSEGKNVRVELGTSGTLTLEQGGTIAGTLESDGKAGLNVAGGTLEVETLSGSLSSLQLGANSELRIGNGDITLSSSFTWESGAKLTLEGRSKLTLNEKPAGSGKLTIVLTQEEVDKGRYQLFGTGWEELLGQWSDYFDIVIDGGEYLRVGYCTIDPDGVIKVKENSDYRDVPPRIGPTTESGEKLRYEVGAQITDAGTYSNLDPSDIRYDVNLNQGGILTITFNETSKRSNLWVNVSGGANFRLNIAGLRSKTLLIRGTEGASTEVTLQELNLGGTTTSQMSKLEDLYVEGGRMTFRIGQTFQDEGIFTNLHLNTTGIDTDTTDDPQNPILAWESPLDEYYSAIYVGDMWTYVDVDDHASAHIYPSFSTNGKLYVGDCDLTGKEDENTLGEEERKMLEANRSGARVRLGGRGVLTVDSVWGTNMQLLGTGGTLTLKRGGRLYGELQVNGVNLGTLVVESGELHVRKGSRPKGDTSSMLSKLSLGLKSESGEGDNIVTSTTPASFRMDSGMLCVNEIEIVDSGSRMEFTLNDETKDEAILSLGSGGFTGENPSTGEKNTPRIVLGGDGGADHYQLFSKSTEDNEWWGDWYVEYVRQQGNIIFSAPEAGGKQVRLSYDGRIHFVDDLNELTLVWEGAGDESKILEWKTAGSAEWTQFGGEKVAWSELEGYVQDKWLRGARDAWLRGNAGVSYDVLLQEDVITGDLIVDGATYTLKKGEGSKLIVSGALITQNGGTLAIGDGVTVAPRHYAGDGAVQLLDGGTLNLGAGTFSDVNGEALEVKGYTASSPTLSLIVGERTAGTETSTPNGGGVIVVDNNKTLNIQQVSGTGDLIINSNADDATVNLHFMDGTVGSLNQSDMPTKNDLRVNLAVSGSLEFLRDSAVKGVATFNDRSKVTMGGDLSVGLLSGGSSTEGLETGVEITAANNTREHTLHLTGGASSGDYWGTFVLGSEQKRVNMDVKLFGSEYRQGFGNHDVTIWGDLTLKNGILQFSSDNVAIHGTVTADGADIDVGYRATLDLMGTKSFTIDGDKDGYAGYVQTLRFDNDAAADNAGSVLALGGDLEVKSIEYGGEDSSRVRHRIERAENAQEETVYVLLTKKRAGSKEIETLQDFRDDYSKNDGGGTGYTGVDLRQGVGIGWAGEGELLLKGDENGGTFSTPFKLKGGSLRWTEGTQTMTDFTAAQDAQMTVTKGKLTLEQFHGEFGTLTLGNGATLGVKYGTLKAQNLRAMEGTGDATLEVNISEDKARLSFGSIQGSLQLQLTGWNELGDQTIGYRLFDNKDDQWRTLWGTLGEKWAETLTFLDDDGKEINSMVELTSEGVVRLRLVDGDLYWDGAASEELTWSKPYVWNSGAEGEGGATASFENGKRVHLEANGGDPAKVTLDVDAIAGSMDVQGAYSLEGGHTLRVQKELTVGADGNLEIEKNTQVVVRDYVNIDRGGSITLATDMVIGGNIGGGGKVKKAYGASDDVYVLWNNGGNGEITWKGSSWGTYVDDVLAEGVGYGKTGRTELSIYGERVGDGSRKAVSLGRNFKAEQGKTTFRSGLTLNGHKLVVGEDARIIIEGTDGLQVGPADEKVDLGYAGTVGGHGTIEITAGATLSGITSEKGAELHVTVAEGGNVELSDLELNGGLVLESGAQVTFTGANTVNGLDATGISERKRVVVAAGSTTKLIGDVDIAHGLELNGTIEGSSNMTVHGGLTGEAGSSLAAENLTLTGGADETKSYKGGVTLSGKLDIRGGAFVFEGSGNNKLTVQQVSSSDGGLLKLVYGDGLLQEGCLHVGGVEEGGLELELTGLSEKNMVVESDAEGNKIYTYQLFDSKIDNDLIHFTGWTDDESAGLNPKKLVLREDGKVTLYAPQMEGDYQAWLGEGQEVFTWTSSGLAWQLPGDNRIHPYDPNKKVYFVGTTNKEVTVDVRTSDGAIMAQGGMSVLLGKGGLGGKYVFDMVSNLIVNGDGLLIGEDTHVQFVLRNSAYLYSLGTRVETGAVMEIRGDDASTRRLSQVEIEKGGEVIIYQPNNWLMDLVSGTTPGTQFKGKGKLTVDLHEYGGSQNFTNQFTGQLFHYNDANTQAAIIEDNKLQTFEFRGAFIQLQGDGYMAAFKALKDVIVGEGSCLILDHNGIGTNGWGFLNEENVNIHLVGDGYKDDNSTPAGNSVVNGAAFSFYTHDSYNGDDSTAQTVKTPWGFTLDADATMRIGRDDGPAHVLQLGGAFNGNGHTLTKIGGGVLEFGFGCTVEEGSTGGIVVADGTLKLGYVEFGQSSKDEAVGLKNYAVSVSGGTTLDMDNRDHLLGSLDVENTAELLNIQGTTITINGYGDGNLAPSGFERIADNVGLSGTSWVMNGGEQTVKNAGSLNEVEVNDGKLVLEGVSTVKAARVNGGTLELDGDVTISTTLKADGGELMAHGSLTVKDGMNGTLDKLTIKGGSDDKIVVGGSGEQVLRAREVEANGAAAIQIDISGSAEPHVRLDVGAIAGKLHLNLTGYSSDVTEYQLFVNNNQYTDLWASAVLKSDESWWKDVLSIEVSGTDWHEDETELKLTDDGVLHFVPFDGLLWRGTDPENNVWKDTEKTPWKLSGEGALPAGKHVKFTDGDNHAHEGTVLVDGMVTPKKVTILGGRYVFKQKPGTAGGLNIVQVELKEGDNEDGSADVVLDKDSGVLVVGDAKGSMKTELTLALKNASIPEIQLEDDGWLVLADDGALTNEDKVRGYKKTRLRFMGGTLDYSAYEGKTLKDLDVSVYVDKDDSRDAAKVHVSGTGYANGVVWGGREKAMTSGIELALNGTGLELTGDGSLTLAWNETAGKTYGSGVGVKVVDEDATLVFDVGGKARADLADTFSGAGTLAITGGGMLKLSGDSTGMKNIELHGFDVEIAGENALGGENTRLTLGNGGKLSSAADAKAQAGTVTVEGAITVGGNITFTGKVGEPKDKEKSTSFTVAEGKTAGFSGDISEYHGTLVAPDASSTWRMTDKAATGEVSVGLEGNGTFDFEVQNSLTLSVPDKPDEDGETVKGMIGSEGGSLTLKNSGAGNLIVASGTEQSGVKLDAGEKTGRITLGKDGDGAAITWAGTDLVQGDIVLANVTLAEGGFKDTGSAKIGVDTSVSPDKESGGTVDVSGMDAGKLSGITINEHGQLKRVTGRYDIGRHEDRMHYGLTLHFANTNERAGGDVALIQGGESEGGKFTLNLMGNAEDDLQFVFNADVIAQLRSADAKDETLDLHLLSGGRINENGKELGVEGKDIKLGEMKDQIAQMLYGISATIVEDPKGEDEWYLQLSGSTSNLYVVMGREHSDLDYVEDMMIFTGTDATAVLDRKTLTLHHDGTSKGAGEVTLKNLVGTEGTVLELENTSPDDRFTVTLDNTHYSGEMNVGTDRDITGAEQTAMRGQDTVFEGRIHGTEGVDITKDGMGTLTVGGDYRLEDGTTRIEGGKLVLEGGENKMDKLEFAYDDEPGAGAQGNPPGAENPEERGLVLDGGRTTIDSIEEGGNNSNGNHVELSNADLVLKDKSELRSTTITGNEEKGGGTVTLDGSNAKLTFTGGKDRMKGVDVNLKNGGSLTLTGGAGMDVGDVNLSGKEGSRLDVGTGETKVDSLNGDRYSTLASDERWGCLRVREGGVFSGTLDSSSAAGTLIVENGANFTFDNVTTKTDDPTKGWDVQVGSDPAKAGGAVFTVDARAKEKSVTLGNVDLGTGNTTTFIVDPAKGGTGLLSGESIKWGKDSTLVLQGDGVYEGDSLTLGSFNTMGENGDDLQIELRGSAFFLKDEKKAKVVESSDGKLTVNFDGEAKDNKFERILPDMSKNAGAGASMVWDSLKEKDGMGALEDVFKNPDSDYAKMANGLIGMYDSGDKENLEKALASAAGAAISTLGPALVQDLHRQLGAIRNRTTTMGGEVSYDSYDKLPMWHAWLNAEGSYHKMDADGFAPGYTLNNWGGTVGADVDVSTSTTLGFALTAMYGDLKPDAADAATGDLDTMYLSAFARTTKGAWIHTFVVSGGMADVNLDRTVNVGGASYRTQGSTDGYAVGALYEVGYTKLMNRRGTIALQPVFNVEIRHAAIKGYTETGSDAGLKVDDIEQDVVTFGVGARMQSIVGENFYNRTSILEARLLLKADVGDASGVSRNGIIGSTAMGEVESAEVGALGIEAGVGLTIPLGSTRGSVFIDASAEVRSGWTSFDATLGYRINF